MGDVVQLARMVQEDPNLAEAHIESLIVETDVSNHRIFLGVDGAKQAVRQITEIFVDRLLNNPDVTQVPLRRKTKLLLILNNFALHKALRPAVFDGLKNMTGVFEDSMKREGAMPFDSELGRMSEHVLVLLMRVCNYKLKAAQVHEFAEFNTQFAVQLLLAILLKEPPYEFELRCNCLSGLLGFTQPQAFFQAGGSIELHSCSQFNEKIDFINNLMMRLSALQVIADVLSVPLMETPSVLPLVHLGVTNTMRCVMNIFQFSSVGATQWRQHVLLSTTFVDSVAVLYVFTQVRAIDSMIAASPSSPIIGSDMLAGVSLTLKFMAFATFHMGRHARITRPLCSFILDLLTLRVSTCLSNPAQHSLWLGVYTQLFHFMANIDALAGESGIEADMEAYPEMSSASLKEALAVFIASEIVPCGPQMLDAFHSRFYSVDTDALVAQDGVTFQAIDAAFYEAKARLQSSAPPAAPAAAATSGKRHLADAPSLKTEKYSMPTAPVAIQQSFVAPQKTASQALVSPYACALNGHTMKVPMLSPYGHNFEKETIEQWLQQQGSVCPITGKPLFLEQLQLNRALQNEIMQAVVRATMTSESQEDQVDLYEF